MRTFPGQLRTVPGRFSGGGADGGAGPGCTRRTRATSRGRCSTPERRRSGRDRRGRSNAYGRDRVRCPPPHLVWVDRHGVRRAVVRTSSSSAMRAPRSAGMFKGPPRSTQVRRDPRRPERVDDGSPAAARRLIIASTTRRVNGLPVSVDALGTAPPRPSSRRLPGLPPGPGVAIPERTTRRAKAPNRSQTASRLAIGGVPRRL